MSNNSINKKHYFWIDNIKLFACVLVVLGHFYMSMIETKILPDNTFYKLIIQSVYTFHVPLFFVCSAFLYQCSNRVHSVKAWGKNVLDKFINLGIPYFTFTTITLVLKTVFADSVNNEAGNFFETLFIDPIAPYWYLYALFFFFLIIPNLNTKKQAYILFTVSAVLKVIYILLNIYEVQTPYLFRSVSGRLIWFALGILLAFEKDNIKIKFAAPIMVLSILGATGLSVYFYRADNNNEIVKFIIGFLFVIFFTLLFNSINSEKLNKMGQRLSKYFMPVYVMHTITSAAFRAVLVKLGIMNPFIHIIVGLIAGFIVPAVIYLIAEKLPIAMIFIYPKKAAAALKKGKQK